MGTYIKIESVQAPASAAPGETVEVTVNTRNVANYAFYIHCVASFDGTRFIDWIQSYVAAGAYRGFVGHFVMPAKAVTVYAAVYYEGSDAILYKDDEAEVQIALAGVGPAEFRDLVASYGRAT